MGMSKFPRLYKTEPLISQAFSPVMRQFSKARDFAYGGRYERTQVYVVSDRNVYVSGEGKEIQERAWNCDREEMPSLQ